MKKLWVILLVSLFVVACSGEGKRPFLESDSDLLYDGDAKYADVNMSDDADVMYGVDLNEVEDKDETSLCNEGDTKYAEACGFNNRGLQEWLCKGGEWKETRNCKDPDECLDNQKNYKTDCGINNRGKIEWICIEGVWSETTVCKDSDECEDASIIHRDEIDENHCGVNNRGWKQKKCIHGFWVNYLESEVKYCDDSDECVDDSIEHLEEVNTNHCGLNNRGWKQKICVEGAWKSLAKTDDGYCDDADVCVDGTIEHLEELEGNECGLNNRGWRQKVCFSGTWHIPQAGEDDFCGDPDECVDDSIEHLEEVAGNECGLNDRGWRQKKCVEGVWMGILEGNEGYCDDPDECVDSSIDEVSGSVCGYYSNGHKRLLCEAGVWIQEDECVFNCPEQIQGYGEIYYINSRARMDSYKDATTLRGIFVIQQYDDSGHKQIDSIAGLDCLKRIEGSLGVANSDSEDLKEFASIEKIDEALSVFQMNSLVSLDGLTSIQEIGAIYVKENRYLTSIEKLYQLTTSPLSDTEKVTISIKDNPKLPQCSVNAFITFLEDDLGFTGIEESSGNDTTATCE